MGRLVVLTVWDFAIVVGACGWAGLAGVWVWRVLGGFGWFLGFLCVVWVLW